MGAREEEFGRKLIDWWAINKKEFPWRKTTDPYCVLLAELLLRKTTGKQVERIYPTLICKYPNLKELAEANENELKQLLKPLGMENIRTALLKNIAQEINSRFAGKVPNSEQELLSLSGVGKYAANAILCMANDRDVPMVDTNAIRIVQRVYGYKSQRKRPRDDKEIWLFVSSLIPKGKAKSFNLAIIDFAHAVCLPSKPNCLKCPIKQECIFAKTQIPAL